MTYILALTIGVVCGLRPILTLAIVVWQLRSANVDLAGTSLQLLSRPFASWLLILGAITELVFDRRSSNQSRRKPVRFALRLVCGAIAGAAISAPDGNMLAGGLCGLAGAIVGCLGGIATRRELRFMFRNDRVAGLVEDVVVLVAAFVVTGARW